MPINIGPTVRRRREWARLSQQELVDHTRMERSASYISAIETGRTSPTLAELEQLARYFRLSVIDLLQEAIDDSERRGAPTASTAPAPDDRLERAFGALSEADQELALEFMQLLARHRR
ncbi:MAG TPA: helix-turn-helix transcriptional regulator [Armatimonadota bacterium]|nr:helix-turn-helix transcriptional regulator [Armatimonadota bacterium]